MKTITCPYCGYKYCRATSIILTIIVGLALSSCSTQVNFIRKGAKSYPPREDSESVVFYNEAQDIPIDSKKIGRLEAICANWMENCDSASIFSLSETKIKKAGGNALLITKFEKPLFRDNSGLSLIWNNYQNSLGLSLSGDVFLVHDFSSPPDTIKKMDFADKYMYAGMGFGPETELSLPKVSFYNFQNRNHFETYYGGEVGIWGLVAFWASLDCLYGIKKNIFTLDTSLGVWWGVSPDNKKYFHTTINPKIGVKFWKLWIKAGPSKHLYRSDPDAGSFGKIGNMYYNFEVLIKL